MPVSPAGSRRGDGRKLAAKVASQIVQDVVAQGWPVGKVLGSAADLLQHYDISRAVFREAVRLLEHQQVARTQRGPGGGLVVIEPSVEAIMDAVTIYLYRVDARVDEVFEARLVLEEIVTDLAPRRLDRQRRAGLRAFLAAEQAGSIADPQAMHALLAASTGNPALELVVEMLSRVSELYMRTEVSVDATTVAHAIRAHTRIGEAVLAGDRDLACERMRQHLSAELDFLQRRGATRQVLPQSGLALSARTGHKRAEQVARAIFHKVISERLQPGHLLGSEAELIEQYEVSRAVFREAVRLLEYHHLAAMRRGPHGGLFVDAPSTVAVADVVALYLARHGTTLRSLAELRVLLEVALVDLAIDRLDETAAHALDEATELDEGGADADAAIHNLHSTVASLTRNQALELVALVLIRLTRLHQLSGLSDGEVAAMPSAVRRAHIGIADAIKAGDHGLSRRRMVRHLEALSDIIERAAG